MAIYFKDIDENNKEHVMGLKIKPEQAKFIETVEECLTEASQYSEWHPVAIYHGADLVGFAMYGSFGPNKNIWIDRILIDERYQGKGDGKTAMKQLIDVVSKAYEVNTIYLSIIESNAFAYKLYTSIGFEDMKELDPENGELMFRYVVDKNIRD